MKSIDCKGDAKLVVAPSQTTLNLDDVNETSPDRIHEKNICAMIA
jgi:hypothetical protein